MLQAMRYLGVRNEEAMIATKKAVQIGAGLNSIRNVAQYMIA